MRHFSRMVVHQLSTEEIPTWAFTVKATQLHRQGFLQFPPALSECCTHDNLAAFAYKVFMHINSKILVLCIFAASSIVRTVRAEKVQTNFDLKIFELYTRFYGKAIVKSSIWKIVQKSSSREIERNRTFYLGHPAYVNNMNAKTCSRVVYVYLYNLSVRWDASDAEFAVKREDEASG